MYVVDQFAPLSLEIAREVETLDSSMGKFGSPTRSYILVCTYQFLCLLFSLSTRLEQHTIGTVVHT
jgi:hypothetical protein